MENDDDTPRDDAQPSDALELRALGEQALQIVHTQAIEHPLRTVGIAMGVGYVIGGGLPKLLVRLGMIAAGRALAQAATVEGARLLLGMAGIREAEDEVMPAGATADEPAKAKNGHRRRRGAAQARAERQD